MSAARSLKPLSPLAVLVGLLLDNLSTAMVVKLVGAAWIWSTAGLLATVSVLGACCSVLGGYAAGRFAGYRETLHGLIVGVADIVVGVAGLAYFGVPLPAWYKAVSFISIIPATTLGGLGAERSREMAAGD